MIYLCSFTQEGLSRIEVFKSFFFFLNKAEEYLFQIKFNVQINCVKLMKQTRAALAERWPGAFPIWPLVFLGVYPRIPRALQIRV